MRQKVRLRNRQRLEVYRMASTEAEQNIYPEFKKFINELPLKDRVFLAWRLLWRKF